MKAQKNVLILGLVASCLCTSCSSNKAAVLEEPEPVEKPALENEGIPMIWKEYLSDKEAGKINLKLPDFSYAGYHHAEVAVPDVTHKVFDVTQYGAIPDDDISDRQALIDAIAAAEANGSGIVYFPAGRFILHSEGDSDESIRIRKSHIVLRGSGCGEGGTELFMKTPIAPKNPQQMWASPSMILFDGGYTGGKVSDVSADASRGSFSVELASTGNLKVGQWVILSLADNNPELVAKELSPYAVDPALTEIIKGVQVRDMHYITAIEGNKVIFKEPIMHAVESKYKWNVTRFLYQEENGIEDIAFIGNFHENFIHHKSWLHDGGYKPVNIKNNVNSWLRRCRFVDISEAVSVIGSANISVYSCIIEGNPGHSAIRSQGSSRVFLGAIEDKAGQWHSVGVSKPAMGTVVWRVKMKDNTSFEMHASQPRATLFDASEGGYFRQGVGGDAGNTPFHLGDLVFWNYYQKASKAAVTDLWGTGKYKGFVMPLFVGLHGVDTTFDPKQVTLDESHGKKVVPESLFEAQLELRLGAVPVWLTTLKSEILK